MAQSNKKEDRKMVEVIRFTEYKKTNSSLVGFATIRYENVAFSGVRLLQSREGRFFISFPSEGPDQEHQYPTVWMAYEDKGDNREAYQMITEAILEYLHALEADKPVSRPRNGNRF